MKNTAGRKTTASWSTEVDRRFPYSPEFNLLLACNDASIEPNEALRLNGLLSENLDWNYFLRVAQAQRMVPQAYWHLRHVGDRVPADVLQRLHDAFRATVARKLLFSSRLLELLGAFEANAVHAMPFKGPVLGLKYYGNVGLRDFEDLDILVDKRDVAAAERVLLHRGFSRQYLSPLEEHVMWRSGHERSFISQDRQVVVELQWGFVWKHLSFSLPFSELWERAERFSLGGIPVRTLAPEDMLLLLCVHGAKHGWKHLIWVCDVAQVLRRHAEIKWTEVVRRAKRLGCERSLLLGLHLAHGMMRVPLPEEIMRRLQGERGVHSLATQVYGGILASDGRGPVVPAAGPFSWFYFKTKERLRDRLYYLFQFAITPTRKDWAQMALPPRLFFIYSVLKPIRLSAEVLVELVATIRRKAASSRRRVGG